MADVKLTGVAKAYGETKILHGIDLDIRDGEFMVFVGPSGCGKSTLLRTIAGLEEITGGELRIGGVLVNDIPPAERGIAMVFQSYALYPHMNLYDNMAFGLKLAKVPKNEIDGAVRNAAKILHIEHLLDRKPKDLSGGQRQRVAIGRAIVRKPEVFLFDEPLSNLDAALRVRMRYEFAKLHEDLKTTMVYVTHDQVEAMTLADRIVVLSAGRIEQVGTPLELYEHPDNLFVAGFIGSPKMNLLTGELAAVSSGRAEVRLAGGLTMLALVDASRARVGDKVTLGVRPEHIRVGGEGNLLQSTVAFVESLGGTTFAYCPYPGLEEPLTCQFEGRNGCDRLRAGTALDLQFPAEALYLFDAEGRAFRRQAAPELAA
ncbi:ABC transporter ATP-binding protein [Roseateles toxinivorans]|uniref:Sorbitol ABC transporter ATP-binding protein /mannitol ABC transporter ATP-binding protein n=1 Tax=Roseateles toxinivorans TaxID=270368 RepID=A0A4R6QKM3_9BURK|nr:sn-glycerol-3-phosphate ABC transporter ATP-binding protein UgpC [Roseateles toxinivorans]TDP63109.1 sorbitol ABC transporter ATP-binding protein /mannitol ABC transporter ATP-binding protein [Roseateles toxinivorans]